jgi:hypothetical protein
MDYLFLLHGIKNILLNPSKYWITIHSEKTPVKLIRNSILLPLVILVSIALTTGSLIFFNTELSVFYSILMGIRIFIVLTATIYITSYILGEITYPLDLGKDFSTSFSLIVYSLTPFLLCQIISSVFESLLFVNLTGLYGLYIFWTGAEVMLKPPQHKMMPMLIATTVVLIGVYVIADLFLTMVTNRIYYAYFA